MRLSWAMLANAAEVRDGLSYVLGGGFDTIYTAELPARLVGTVLLRMAMSPSEADHPHAIGLVILDEDGKELSRLTGEFTAERADLPLAWEQGVMLAVNIAGLPLPKFGLYRVDVLLDGRHEGSLNLRVVQREAASA